MLDKNGHEVPDPSHMEIPLGFRKPETLAQQVQRLVRTNVSREAQAAGMETFEESEDFDVDDEMDPHAPYEEHFDPVLGKGITTEEFHNHQAHYRAEYLAAQTKYFASLDADINLASAEPLKEVSEEPKKTDQQPLQSET